MPGPVEAIVRRTLARADVRTDGSRPWDIKVNRRRFYRRAARGSLGLGEAYMDGDWDAEDLETLFRKLIRSGVSRGALSTLNQVARKAWSVLSNLQSRRGSRAVIDEHYDLDHRLYECFLGPYNQYTCCFFDGTDDLGEAERKKLEVICSKLELTAGDTVLDIGCGWGGFAKYASETRGCHVTGISLSGEQVEYARKFTRGLPVEIMQCDYRDLPARIDGGAIDKVLICGMIEHVGYKNYRSIFEVVDHVLARSGLFLLHTIGSSHEVRVGDPWTNKYIFRNSMLPAMKQLSKAMSGLFVMHDWENYGYYYTRTLDAWRRNFESNWDRIKRLNAEKPFDERFRRMWNYYLITCKAAFSVEHILLWQIVMQKPGQPDDVYHRVKAA